ncbi:MAG: NifB/NifX family molybdenum-iron cluster-binding protein [Oscillospiraceae bacterium]|jgi:Uncharacterized conserved protein|nr:NifB/NifX family molybdenum-iron cluster-binding protein [Oscillospiraceae bacterium]
MKIAVAYENGEIFGHFGHCAMFAIYEYGEYVHECTKTLVETGGRQGHQAMADLMREQEVDAVIAGNMGGEAKALLLSYGIVPVAGYSGDADTAADLLVTGQLPITPGEGGGCSSCAGNCSCGSDGGEGCSCGGCGCGC